MALGAGRYVSDQAAKLVDDPLGYFITASRRVGVGLLLAGTGAGVAAYYLKASATAAMNNETIVLGNIATIFSNIKAPSFTPAALGTAPVTASLQGVQNFAGDVQSDVQAAGADLAGIGGVIGTLGEDVAAGLVDLAKAALAFVMHFPDILWNGLVWGIGGAIADILTWAFPWLLIFGGALVIASTIAYAIRRVWRDTIGAAWSESWEERSTRMRVRAKAWFDRLLHNEHPPEPKGPDSIAEGVSPAPVDHAPNLQPAPVMAAPAQEGAPEPPEAPSLHEKVGGGDASSAPDPADEPLPAGWTQEEMESYLGEARTAAQDAA